MTAAGLKAAQRRGTVLAAAIAALTLAGAAHAYADPVDLQVVDRQTGRPLQVWRHDGRLFVAGQPGSRYSLRVTNHTDGRVLVVMSVDGLNVLTGETAGYDQRGYIFAAHQSYDILGWRKSLTEVAAFTFAPLPQSYAARTGRPADVGVIGIAAFKERVIEAQPVAAAPQLRDDVARTPFVANIARVAPRPPMVPPADIMPPAPVAMPPPAAPPPPPPPPALAARSVQETVVVPAERRAEKLGTAHGALEQSVTTMVPFDRATAYPQFLSRIEYDTYENLVAAGVIACCRPPDHRPRPFPANPGANGFVPDPPPEP